MTTIEVHSSEQRELFRAMAIFIIRRTVAICDRNNIDRWASGITINYGSRVFVATAAHVLERCEQPYLLLRDGHSIGYSDFLAVYTDRDDDVGILEINPASQRRLAESTHHAILDEENFYTGRYPRPNIPIRLVGYPSQEEFVSVSAHRITHTNTLHEIGLGTLNYDTHAIPSTKWPVLMPPNREVRQPRDIFCHFDPTCGEATRFNLQEPLDFSDVHKLNRLRLPGMSGGGLWIPTLNQSARSGLSTPSAMLVGLQSSYPTNGRGEWLRGTRTIALLDLIRKHYP